MELAYKEVLARIQENSGKPLTWKRYLETLKDISVQLNNAIDACEFINDFEDLSGIDDINVLQDIDADIMASLEHVVMVLGSVNTVVGWMKNVKGVNYEDKDYEDKYYKEKDGV